MNTSSEIVIELDNNTLKILQSKKSFIKTLVCFCFLCLIILGGMYLFYFFLSDKIPFWIYEIVATITVFIYFLLNKRRLKSTIIEIRVDNNLLFVNKQISCGLPCSKRIVLCEFTGETLIEAEGNLFVNFNNNEYPIAYSATAYTIEQISKALNSFFCETIMFERKKIYN